MSYKQYVFTNSVRETSYPHNLITVVEVSGIENDYFILSDEQDKEHTKAGKALAELLCAMLPEKALNEIIEVFIRRQT